MDDVEKYAEWQTRARRSQIEGDLYYRMNRRAIQRVEANLERVEVEREAAERAAVRDVEDAATAMRRAAAAEETWAALGYRRSGGGNAA